jgi:hypothetical protein
VPGLGGARQDQRRAAVGLSISTIALYPSPLRGGKLRALASSRVGSSYAPHPASRPCRSPPSPQGGGIKRVRRASSLLLIQISNSHASSAGVGSGSGAPVSFLIPRGPGGVVPRKMPEGAERRPAHQHIHAAHVSLPASRASCAPAWTSQLRMPRRPALHCGDFGPRDRTSGVRTGLLNPRSGGFRRLRPSHVQPLKAAPHSWRGRLPLASRSMIASHAAGAAPAPPNRTPLADAPG